MARYGRQGSDNAKTALHEWTTRVCERETESDDHDSFIGAETDAVISRL